MDWLTQWVTTHGTESAAVEALIAMRAQDGYVCGRVVDRLGKVDRDSPARYSAQAFFPDCGAENAANLPDDQRRVIVPESLLVECRAWERRHAMA